MAGLTAAHFLGEAGIEVIVVEQDNRLGGRIMSVRKGDDTIDVGAQFIHTNYKVTLELCRKFNLESDLVEMRSNDMMMRGGQVHIIPWGSLRIPAISLWSQLKNLRQLGPVIRRRKSMALDGWRNLLDLDRLELATYARLKLNEELLEYTVRPHMKYAGASKSRYVLAWPLGSFGEEIIGLSDPEIISAVAEELRKASPGDAASVESTSVVRHPHRYPQYRVGMFGKLLSFKASEGRPAGLYFAGDYTEGGLIEGAAQSGYKVAQRVIEKGP